MAVDGRDYPSQSQGTLVDIRPSPIFSSGGLDDGDHQLFVIIPSFPVNGLIFLDYFEYVVTLPSSHSKGSVLTDLTLLGLKTRQDGASIFSVLGQLRLTYPHRRSLWTILTQVLYFRMLPSGRLKGMLVVTKELSGGRPFPVLR